MLKGNDFIHEILFAGLSEYYCICENSFCGIASCMEFDKLPQVMSPESTLDKKKSVQG